MDTSSSIQTGGGAVVPGSVNTRGDFVGRDQIVHNHFGGQARPAPVDLGTALAKLAELPLVEIPPLAPLPPGSRLPYAVNPHFVGREHELRQLATLLKQGINAAISPLAAATGQGGMGKTQLATMLAHHYGQYFLGGVYWLSFADPVGIPAEMAACAATMLAAPLGLSQWPLAEQVQWVQRQWQEPLPRLLIFDNCEDPALL